MITWATWVQERRHPWCAQRQRPHERRGGTKEEVELRAGQRPSGDGSWLSAFFSLGQVDAHLAAPKNLELRTASCSKVAEA